MLQAFLPRASGRRGSWNCSPRMVTALGKEAGLAQSSLRIDHSSVLAEARGVLQLPPPQVLTWNREKGGEGGQGAGSARCAREGMPLHILSRPKAAFQPSSCSASAGSA